MRDASDMMFSKLPVISLDLTVIHQMRAMAKMGATISELIEYVLSSTGQKSSSHLNTNFYVRPAFLISIKDSLDFLADRDKPSPAIEISPISKSQDQWDDPELSASELRVWTDARAALETAINMPFQECLLSARRNGESASMSREGTHGHCTYKLGDGIFWTFLFTSRAHRYWEFAGLVSGDVDLGSEECPICAAANKA